MERDVYKKLKGKVELGDKKSVCWRRLMPRGII